MNESSSRIRKFPTIHLNAYFQTENTDEAWLRFEEAFFGADRRLPRPQRYQGIRFEPGTFQYQVAQVLYWLVFDPASVPAEIKAEVAQMADHDLVERDDEGSIALTGRCTRRDAPNGSPSDLVLAGSIYDLRGAGNRLRRGVVRLVVRNGEHVSAQLQGRIP